jgi:hypothetical protein
LGIRRYIEVLDALLDNLADLRWIQLLHAKFLNPGFDLTKH